MSNLLERSRATGDCRADLRPIACNARAACFDWSGMATTYFVAPFAILVRFLQRGVKLLHNFLRQTAAAEGAVVLGNLPLRLVAKSGEVGFMLSVGFGRDCE